MANDVRLGAYVRVQVCYALRDSVWRCDLELATGATVAQALTASGFARRFPGIDAGTLGVGIYGKRVAPSAVLADGDRVEIYRALNFDPKESRRRRVEHRRAKQAQQGRERPPGLL
ncbi:RnfH family protein [Bordetella sp. FB-8]|uniref:RnfH family protein n=1 Tax=Bordetella sp. FB-8 TaxID=1159870 RepID=UPI000377F459|nr:RnfH family protein [Bordetella sp. FB-8]